jgi:proteasome lid subunit RPN8/RPN11
MEISLDMLKAIALHGQEQAPQEACGVLVEGAAVRCDNVSAWPQKRFEMEASVWVDYEVEGFYHSHPEGDQGFSEQDRQVAQFLRIPSIVYIVATDTVEILDEQGQFSRIVKVSEQ